MIRCHLIGGQLVCYYKKRGSQYLDWYKNKIKLLLREQNRQRKQFVSNTEPPIKLESKIKGQISKTSQFYEHSQTRYKRTIKQIFYSVLRKGNQIEYSYSISRLHNPQKEQVTIQNQPHLVIKTAHYFKPISSLFKANKTLKSSSFKRDKKRLVKIVKKPSHTI